MESLHHENILQFLGCIIVSDVEAWIVTPLVEGGNLFSFLRSNTQLDWNTKLRFALQATTAISYLHNLTTPILHRDIKSSNILVQDGSTLLLCDFGLAGVTDSETHRAGTPAYMAPELWGKFWHSTEKTDVYSLGMVPPVLSWVFNKTYLRYIDRCYLRLQQDKYHSGVSMHY